MTPLHHGSQSRVEVLQRLPRVEAKALLLQISSIERKTFPTNEALQFDPSLLSKANTTILLVRNHGSTSNDVVGYALFVRFQKTILLHKICVAAAFRGRNYGRHLLEDIISRSKHASCRKIELWVDESRSVARALYTRHHFIELESVENYYAPGRTGIKMCLDLV